MRKAVGPGGGWGGQGRRRARARRPRGLLVHRQHPLLRTAWPRVERNTRSDRGVERRLPRLLGMAPQMRPPGLQWMGRQTPPYRRGGDVLDDGLSDQRPRQCMAIPWGEAAAQDGWARASPAHHRDGDLGGTKRPWPHGQERHTAPQAAGRETASPTGARRPVGRRPPEPPGLATVGQPAASACVPGVPSPPPSWSSAASVAGSAAHRGHVQ